MLHTPQYSVPSGVLTRDSLNHLIQNDTYRLEGLLVASIGGTHDGSVVMRPSIDGVVPEQCYLDDPEGARRN